jgi:hypothetical protein
MNRTQFPNKQQQPMPGNVRGALAKRNLMDAYRARPQYQQDDYLKWIAQAFGPAAKQQRLDQMLDELEKGNVYKGEPYTPPAKVEPAKAAPAEDAKPAPAKAAKPEPAPAKPAPAKAAKPEPAAAKPAAKAPAKPAAKPAAKAPAKKK